MAGGEGTRLRPLTYNQPKPMIPMANRVLMEHVVALLKRYGFSEIVVTVGFQANAIQNYFGNGGGVRRPDGLRQRGSPSRDGGLGAQC